MQQEPENGDDDTESAKGGTCTVDLGFHLSGQYSTASQTSWMQQQAYNNASDNAESAACILHGLTLESLSRQAVMIADVSVMQTGSMQGGICLFIYIGVSFIEDTGVRPPTIDKAIVQPESDKICAVICHVLFVFITCACLALGNLVLMMRENLQACKQLGPCSTLWLVRHCFA